MTIYKQLNKKSLNSWGVFKKANYGDLFCVVIAQIIKCHHSTAQVCQKANYYVVGNVL